MSDDPRVITMTDIARERFKKKLSRNSVFAPSISETFAPSTARSETYAPASTYAPSQTRSYSTTRKSTRVFAPEINEEYAPVTSQPSPVIPPDVNEISVDDHPHYAQPSPSINDSSHIFVNDAPTTNVNISPTTIFTISSQRSQETSDNVYYRILLSLLRGSKWTR